MTQQLDQESPSSNTRWNRLSLLIMGTGLAALLASAVLFGLIFSGVWDGGAKASGPETPTGFGNLKVYLTPQPTATLPPAPTGTPQSVAPIARVVIPKFDVDAPVLTLGIDENGIMEAPEGPWDAAWYDFSARPGSGGNAVFSGHVDWYNIGPGGGPGGAVFWNLKDLEQGDTVEVHLEDGTVYQYQVTVLRVIDPNTTDVGEIVGPTEDEVITLITCGGTFNPETRHYNMRVVVRAERIVESASR